SRHPGREVSGGADPALHACDRAAHGVAGSSVLRQESRHPRAAGYGAACIRAGGCVLCAAAQLSLGGAERWHVAVPRQLAAELALLQSSSASLRAGASRPRAAAGSRRRGGGACCTACAGAARRTAGAVELGRRSATDATREK